MREITTYSFINAKAFDQLALPADDPRRNAVRLLNPLGEEYAVMRTQLYSSMLTVLSTNFNRKIPAVRLFEAGKLFIPRSLPVTDQPDEVPAICLGMYGEGEDFFTLKGLLETLFSRFGAAVEYVPSAEPFLHPGRQAAAVLGGETIAVFGEVHPDTAARYDIETRVYVAQCRLLPLFAADQQIIRFRPLPRFPAVERDLAVLCGAALPVAEIEKTIRACAGRHLESVKLFDVYRGSQIADGQKSVAYSLTFRSAEGTLTDDEVDARTQPNFKKS